MHYFDSYPLKSRLRNVRPSYKLVVFAVFTLFAILSQSAVISAFILVIHLIGAMVWAQISLIRLMRLMLIPVGFVLMGTLSVAVELNPMHSILQVDVFGAVWGVTNVGLDRAICLFMRSFSTISVLYFLILNTSINDLIFQMRQLRVPIILLEMMILIYRNIFIFSDTAQAIHTAQRSRVGYRNISTSVRSLGLLGGRVFVLANMRADLLYRSMESRCYNGEMRSLAREWQQNRAFIFLSVVSGTVIMVAQFYL